MTIEKTTVTWFGEELTIVEPDYLLDISTIANCFEGFGHHPLLYTINRMKERPNNKYTLLGNFAGSALDIIIHESQASSSILHRTLTRNFREKALEFSTCEDFDPVEFKREALKQIFNIQQAIKALSPYLAPHSSENVLSEGKDRGEVLLEPSFVCPTLGIQGRVDLMTTDFKLLVEQKSGKSVFPLKHYIQVLLYYGVLAFNFQQITGNTDIRLLYSRFPLPDCLRTVNAEKMKGLMRQAIDFRNEVVKTEYKIATQGFGAVYDQLKPEHICTLDETDRFYQRYELPKLQSTLSPLHTVSPLERAYMERMMTFVIREQIVNKVGTRVHGREGARIDSLAETANSETSFVPSPCIADLWRMPMAEKREMGNIYTGLTLESKEQSTPFSGYDLLSFSVPDQGEDFMPNFRRGDMVYVYTSPADSEPDITHSILFKGVLTVLHSQQVTVRLNNGQQNPEVFVRFNWTIEHAGSDAMSTAAIHSLHSFLCASDSVRQLLLAQRVPRRDTTRHLSCSYHPDYDEMVEKAMQSQDYFLLVGPPGTGKTSMALRFLVEESLQPMANGLQMTESALHTPSSSILLLSYTNRAVDEICEMLMQSGHDFIRLGQESSCEPRFAPFLLSSIAEKHPRLDIVKEKIQQATVIVATTSTISAHPHILRQKAFCRIIIDEASQILEPNIIGILSAGIPFILIGDYKQLPAVVQQSEKESEVTDPQLRNIGLTNCRNSLFERLIRTEQVAKRSDFIAVLRKQGRMHPDVAAFANKHFYPDEQITTVPLPHQTTTAIYPPSEISPDCQASSPSGSTMEKYQKVLLSRRVLFFPSPLPTDNNLTDKVNTAEAAIVAELLEQVYKLCGAAFHPMQSVGVIVPYRNQITTIRRAIERLGIAPLNDITIDTVERYQGSQRDVIIYSFTATKNYQLDFLTDSCFMEDGHLIDRKLNVVLTRARVQLLLVGHRELLMQNSLFRKLMESGS